MTGGDAVVDHAHDDIERLQPRQIRGVDGQPV